MPSAIATKTSSTRCTTTIAANRHYLVRYDAILGAVDQREGTTVLANRLDGFLLEYFDSAGNQLDVTTTPDGS